MIKPELYREEGAAPMSRAFLEANAYAKALEAFVVVCADCVLVHRGRRSIFLAKRKSKPMASWWFIGGRIYAGEEETAAIVRCVERETTLRVDPARFTFLSMNRYLFKDRQQEPQEKGCDSLCYQFYLEPTPDELEQAAANLDPREYDKEAGLTEFTLSKLQSESVFSALLDTYNLLFGL